MRAKAPAHSRFLDVSGTEVRLPYSMLAGSEAWQTIPGALPVRSPFQTRLMFESLYQPPGCLVPCIFVRHGQVAHTASGVGLVGMSLGTSYLPKSNPNHFPSPRRFPNPYVLEHGWGQRFEHPGQKHGNPADFRFRV